LGNKTEERRNIIPPGSIPMKTKQEQNKLEELIELASAATPTPQGNLKGQGEVALILRGRGFGIRQISAFLKEHGTPISPTAVGKFLKSNSQNYEKNNTTDQAQ